MMLVDDFTGWDALAVLAFVGLLYALGRAVRP
jgi:hypothetical protein